jgi:hypothetical protein
MTSVKALVFLHCANCQDTVLHTANRCNSCQAPNTSSGNPPVPRPRRYGYATMKAKHYDHEAVRRARRARHQHQSRPRP